MSNLNNNLSNDNAVLLEKELRIFNWGAFFIPWLWALFNKVWLIVALGMIVAFIFVNNLGAAQLLEYSPIDILVFIFSVLVGFTGNRFAWECKNYQSLEKFKKEQRLQSVIILIVFIFASITCLVLLLMYVTFMSVD